MDKFEWIIKEDKKGTVTLKGYKFDIKDFVNSINLDEYFEDTIEDYTEKYLSDYVSRSESREYAEDELRDDIIRHPDNFNILDIFLDRIGEVDLDFSEEYITNIADGAFYNCSNIKSIKLPKTLMYMGEGVFEGCKKLKKIELPSSLKEIQGDTFDDYSGNIKINLADFRASQFDDKAINLLFFKNISSFKGENKENWIEYFKGNMDIYYDRIINEKDSKLITFFIDNKCFSLEDIKTLLNLSAEKNKVDISSLLLEYQHNNFTDSDILEFTTTTMFDDEKTYRTVIKNKDHISITRFIENKDEISIEIPEVIRKRKVVEIASEAFSPYQNGLSTKEIDRRRKIKKIVVPSSVSTIGAEVFNGCSALTDIILPDAITSIYEGTFANCVNIKEIVLPKTIREIKQGAFENCKNLKKIVIPFGVCVIEKNAFKDCSKLAEIVLPESLVNIENSAFENCTSLENINLPSSLKEIGNKSFKNCAILKEISIPEKTISIKDSAFENCKSLESLEIKESVKELGKLVFKNCSSLEKIVFKCNPDCIWKGGLFEDCTNIRDFIFPENIVFNEFFRGLVSSLFHDFRKLEKLKMPEGWINIPSNAFTHYKLLESIYIPSTVNEIGEFLFTDCPKLKSIEIDNNNKNFYAINNAIYNKDNICIYCPKEEKVEKEFDPCEFNEDILKHENYYTLGYWPQSLKKDTVLIDEKYMYNVHGFQCYKGNDGSYYTKQRYSLSYNNVIMEETLSYYKMESIKWIEATNNYQEKKLLITKDIIQASFFAPPNYVGKKTDGSDYKSSNIRALLNGLDSTEYKAKNYSENGFINKAFSKESQNRICNVSLNFNCFDKLFLLSRKELSDLKKNEKLSYDPSTTDYVKSMCGEEVWWTRTETRGNNNSVFCGNNSTCDAKEIHGIVIALAIEQEGIIIFDDTKDDKCSKIVIKGYDSKGKLLEDNKKILELLKTLLES